MMKRINRKAAISLWALVAFTLVRVFPPVFGIPAVESPGEEEEIILFSDRSLYAVSEDLHFTARYLKSEHIPAASWSSVLYVELIRWDGTKLAQSVAPIREGYASGMLRIPDHINSGNYYLRGYTRWMCNGTPYSYTYLPVKVINPLSVLIDKGPEKRSAPAGIPAVHTAYVSEIIVVKGLRKEYGKREKVELEVAVTDSASAGSFVLSVSIPGGRGVIPDPVWLKGSEEEPEGTGVIEFLPEINGLSITGKVIRREDGVPVRGAKVNLSSYSGSFYFSAIRTGDDGSFGFILPNMTGDHEFHIAGEGPEGRENEILVNSEFCMKPVLLPYVPFELNGPELTYAREIALNAQLARRYSGGETDRDPVSQDTVSFYGIPGSVIHEKDFIELKDLEEFFFELVPDVSVGILGKKPYLVINGNSGLLSYPPLILVDNIPVANDEKLLSTACRRIKRIEVINKGYVVGNFKYGGIVSIFSEEKDLAAELSESNQFFSYRLFSPESENSPEPEGDPAGPTVAERRNLLYWEPCLQLDGTNSVRISFFTSDAPGEYQVCIRSFGTPGEGSIYRIGKFTVK